MHAIVDKDKCIACGLCVEVCPTVFAIEGDGKSGVQVDPVPPQAEAACRDAAEQCPVEAISIRE